jgi:hypothetical protein
LPDKSTLLILDGLSRALAEPASRPLFGNKAQPGLFAPTAAARLAADRCKQENWLRIDRTEKRGKVGIEICSITEKGLAFLLSQVSPRPILEQLVRSLDAHQQQVGTLIAAVHEVQSSIEQLRAKAETVLQKMTSPPNGAVGHAGNGAPPSTMWTDAILDYLNHWQTAHATEDCSLPELYRHAQSAWPDLTIGAFHDGLRRLHEQALIFFHPWTGPLHEIPEPALALLAGHQVAYYASRR